MSDLASAVIEMNQKSTDISLSILELNMKAIFLLSLVALAFAKDFDLEFEEVGKKFVEKINVDVAGNTERIQVPQHGTRPAVDFLKDFAKGLKAEKVVAEGSCYISSLSSDDEKPSLLERDMTLAGPKFPSSRYEVVKNMVYPVRKMSAAEAGEKIAAHCQGLKMIKVFILNKDNINSVVSKWINAKVSGRSKRDVNVEEFSACTTASTNVILKCRPPKRLGARAPMASHVATHMSTVHQHAAISPKHLELNMKAIFLLSLVALAVAKDFDLEFEEVGKKFVEKVNVDVAGNTERIQVPQHGTRPAVDFLKDFAKGLKAEKVVAEGSCYISSLSSDDEMPSLLERDMTLAGPKFPSSRYEVVKNMVFPVREMSAAEAGEKIAAHCQGLKMMKVFILNKDNINSVVSKWINAKVSGRSKRDVTVQTFGACTHESTNVINNCRPPKRLGTVCKFLRSDSARCVYSVRCPMGPNGFQCKGTHVYSSPTCCDFTCL
eukprot:gene18728-20617_t